MRTGHGDWSSLECVTSRTAGLGFEKVILSEREKVEKTRKKRMKVSRLVVEKGLWWENSR